MSNRRAIDRAYRKLWPDFRKRHPSHPALKSKTLYSIPIDLIDCFRRSLPEIFTSDIVEFEIDLARTVSFGFFYGNPIGGSELLDNSRGRSANEQYVENNKTIKKLLKDEYLREGAKELQIERSAELDAQRNEVADCRKQAYIGWLVTNLEYRRDVERHRVQWAKEIGKLRTFPAFPRWTNTLAVHAQFSDELKNDFQKFYAHWELDNLVTWDWPMPMQMDLE